MASTEEWTEAEATKWEAELSDWTSKNACTKCGAKRVPVRLNGRPYVPYVHWHQKKTAELGWTTLRLVGCGSVTDPRMMALDGLCGGCLAKAEEEKDGA